MEKESIKNFEKNPYYHPKRCPGCKTFSSKDDKCNHMTCRYCNTNWCWFCKKIMGDELEHVCESGNWEELHLKGDFNDNFDKNKKELNNAVKLEEEDLLPWEREEDRVTKETIKNFIKSHESEDNSSEDNSSKVSCTCCCNGCKEC